MTGVGLVYIQPYSLHIFSLSSNKIGDAGATAIGEGLKANAVLKDL